MTPILPAEKTKTFNAKAQRIAKRSSSMCFLILLSAASDRSFAAICGLCASALNAFSSGCGSLLAFIRNERQGRLVNTIFTNCSELVLATGNRDKLLELRALLAPLNVSLHSLADFPDVTPAAEDGTTLADNAKRKATEYALQLRRWVLSDDTGLEVDALHGAPGVRSARYAGDPATMAENRARLLADLSAVPDDQRGARFVCCLAVAAPDGKIVAEATGECSGRMRREPAGRGGFGYDSLFEVSGLGRTLAELDPQETARLGHRGRAVRRLLEAWNP